MRSNVDDWKSNANTLRQISFKLNEMAERVESGEMELTGNITMDVRFQTIEHELLGFQKSKIQGQTDSVSLTSDIDIRVRCGS